MAKRVSRFGAAIAYASAALSSTRGVSFAPTTATTAEDRIAAMRCYCSECRAADRLERYGAFQWMLPL